MTHAKAQARRLQVLIGTDNQDWSDHVVEFSAGYSQLDNSGLIFTNGRLVLARGDYPGLPPDTLNIRSDLGVARWNRGVRVIINCTDSAGVFRRHPCGMLFLSKPPSWSDDSQTLELDLVCLLTLQNSAASSCGDKGTVSGIAEEWGTGENAEEGTGGQQGEGEGGEGTTTATIIRGATIGMALANAGVTGLATSIEPPPVTALTSTIPRMRSKKREIEKGDRSWVEIAGQLAYENGTAIYQTNQGGIAHVPINMVPSAPLKLIVIGVDDLSNSSQGNWAELPESENIVVISTIKERIYRDPVNVTVTEEYGPDSMTWKVSSQLSGPAFDIIYKRTTRTDTVSLNKRESVEVIEEIGALVSPLRYPGEMDLRTSAINSTTHQYEQNRLKRITTIEDRILAAAVSTLDKGMRGGVTFYSDENLADEFATNSAALMARLDELVPTKITTTDYFYDEKERVQKIVTTVEELQASFASEGMSSHAIALFLREPEKLVTTSIHTTEWENTFGEEWTRKEMLYEPLIRVHPDFQIVEEIDYSNDDISFSENTLPKIERAERAFGIWLTLVEKESRFAVSESGDTQPPATERPPKLFEEVEKQVKTRLGYYGGRRSCKTRYVDAGEDLNESQVKFIAALEAAIVMGRSRGMQLQIPFMDEFFTRANPLPDVNVSEREVAHLGYRRNLSAFKADSIQYTHNATQGVIGAELIWLGTTEGNWATGNEEPDTPVYAAGIFTSPIDYIEFDSDEPILGDDPGLNLNDLPILPPPLVILASYQAFGFGVEFDDRILPTYDPIDALLGAGFVLQFELGAPDNGILGFGFGITSDEIIDLPLDLMTGLGFALQFEDVIIPIDAFWNSGFGLIQTEIEDAVLEFHSGYGFDLDWIEIDPWGMNCGAAFSSTLEDIIEGFFNSGIGFRFLDFELWEDASFAFGFGFETTISDYVNFGFAAAIGADIVDVTSLNTSYSVNTQGALWAVGSNLGTEAWQHPTARFATLTSSPLYAYAGNVLNNLADRTAATDTLLDNLPNNAWVTVDLGFGRSLVPTQYSLKHAAIWGTFFCPRNWQLRGLNPSTGAWDVLDNRVNDTTINGSSVMTGVFNISGVTVAYRYLSIVETGVNSDGNWYMGFDEIEFYGQVRQEQLISVGMRGDSMQTLSSVSSYSVAEQGAFHAIGTNLGSLAWANPTTRNMAITHSPPLAEISSNVCDRNTATAFYLDTIPNNVWIQFDLGVNRSLIPTQYHFRHPSAWNIYHIPRNWQLRGLNPSTGVWDVLDNRVNDTTINGSSVMTGVFNVTGATVAYRYLQLVMTGLNSYGFWYMGFEEVEFYGTFQQVVPRTT